MDIRRGHADEPFSQLFFYNSSMKALPIFLCTLLTICGQTLLLLWLLKTVSWKRETHFNISSLDTFH